MAVINLSEKLVSTYTSIRRYNPDHHPAQYYNSLNLASCNEGIKIFRVCMSPFVRVSSLMFYYNKEPGSKCSPPKVHVTCVNFIMLNGSHLFCVARQHQHPYMFLHRRQTAINGQPAPQDHEQTYKRPKKRRQLLNI
jgi:hypothetical protein